MRLWLGKGPMCKDYCATETPGGQDCRPHGVVRAHQCTANACAQCARPYS